MFQKSLLLILFLHLFFYIAIGQNIDINTLRRININRDKSLDGTFRAINQFSRSHFRGNAGWNAGHRFVKKRFRDGKQCHCT